MPDVTAISIAYGATATLHLFNLYLDQTHDHGLHATAHASRKLVTEDARLGKESLFTWLGDFNRHHPLWDEERNHHLFTPANTQRAQTLLNRLAEFVPL